MQVIERQSAKWIRPVEYTTIAKCLALLGLPLSSHPPQHLVKNSVRYYGELQYLLASTFYLTVVCLADGFGVAVEHP